MDFYTSAYYGDGEISAYIVGAESDVSLPAAYSRRPIGRGAHDRQINPDDTAWDSDWKIERSEDTGRITGIAYKRRYCKGCNSVIRRQDDGILLCPECGRIFDGGYNDWPITVRYMRSP